MVLKSTYRSLFTQDWRNLFFITSIALFLAACSQEQAAITAIAPTDLPTAIVYKSSTCSCCNKWVDHLRSSGFPVQVREPSDLSAVKEKYRVPHDMRSCHTAVIDGYVVEGHVPATDIQRLLRKRPQAIGLSVPGMPLGSPGMEVDNRQQAYTVWLLQEHGGQVFSQHRAKNLD